MRTMVGLCVLMSGADISPKGLQRVVEPPSEGFSRPLVRKSIHILERLRLLLYVNSIAGETSRRNYDIIIYLTRRKYCFRSYEPHCT